MVATDLKFWRMSKMILVGITIGIIGSRFRTPAVANSLLGIINDILDFSKIEAGKLDMESVEFNLGDVLDNLANLVTVKAQEKKDLEVLFATAQGVPRFLVGDPLRLGQVLFLNVAHRSNSEK